MKPTTVLVAALGVEVAGEAQLRLRFKHRSPACAGVDPDIEDVGLAAELRAAAASALRVRGQNSFGLAVIPCIGAVLVKELDDARIGVGRLERLIALLTQKQCDGHAPDTLAGDAP